MILVDVIEQLVAPGAGFIIGGAVAAAAAVKQHGWGGK